MLFSFGILEITALQDGISDSQNKTMLQNQERHIFNEILDF